MNMENKNLRTFSIIAAIFFIGFLYLWPSDLGIGTFVIGNIQQYTNASKPIVSSQKGLCKNMSTYLLNNNMWNTNIGCLSNIKISLLGDSTAWRTTNGKCNLTLCR